MVREGNNILTLVTAIAIGILISEGAGADQPQAFPPVIIQPENEGNGHCPSQQQRENALLSISSDITRILSSNCSFVPECGEGLWCRVAFLNMTDPTQECPPAWRLYDTSTYGVRACGRPVTSSFSSPATFYPTDRQYSRVCGRVIGYQVATPGAFDIFAISPPPSSVDDIYVDGVSITHGNPRSHIWTFAAGANEGNVDGNGLGQDCPCSGSGDPAPSYIGNNYYCESGTAVNHNVNGLYSDDLLWDGQQCEGQCCSEGNTPPWFKVDLPNPTSDDIEVRICADEDTGNEDVTIGLMEIYVG